MKSLFTFIALGSVAFVSADQYNQPYGGRSDYCPSCNEGGRYYQDQSYNDNYYQRGGNQGQRPYSQRNDQYGRDQQNGDDNNNDYQRDGSSKSGSDEEISRQIHNTLGSGRFSKGFKNVSFDVNNGNVTLSGSVDSLENKNRIEDSVRKIDGVREVKNQIKLVKGTPNVYADSQLQNSEKNYPNDYASNAQDRQLNAKIRDKLNGGWFSKGYDSIVVKTTNGAVVISGTVDQAQDIQKISDQIRDIEGVRSVNNQLTMQNR